MEIKMKMKRFPWYEPQAEENYINQQIDTLKKALQDRGAQFYIYRYWEIMYLNGQVFDLFRKNAVLDLLKRINLLPEAYARDVVELMRSRIKKLYVEIPRNTYGIVNGVREPHPSMGRYLGSAEANWVKEVIESGLLSQS